jgi:phosphotransferase system  glucose/maltose/N-acetylglucosamine-specific IIC component
MFSFSLLFLLPFLSCFFRCVVSSLILDQIAVPKKSFSVPSFIDLIIYIYPYTKARLVVHFSNHCPF